MAKQIAISDEVYSMLIEKKVNNKSFSEVIKEVLAAGKNNLEIEKNRAASTRILENMKKGYNLGKITGNREDWHVR